MLSWHPYPEQRDRWPQQGRHILAHHDDETIVVYQAYRPEIAAYAVEHQAFGGPWSFDRMSWIKPSFLWMMYRCGWASKPGQERVLAIRMSRGGFDTILSRSVESSHHPEITGWDRNTWQRRGRRADVRLQWDPDHSPSGGKLQRRAIQLGLRGETLRTFATGWVQQIVDITDEVVARRSTHDALTTPLERPYRPDDPELCRWLRLSDPAGGSIAG